jgi:hypothetical protein
MRSVVSNEAGEYAFASLVPGVYTVRVSRSGFQPHEHSGLRVTTQSALVYDVLLNPSGITQEITVTTDSSVVERASPAISSSLTAAQIGSRSDQPRSIDPDARWPL